MMPKAETSGNNAAVEWSTQLPEKCLPSMQNGEDDVSFSTKATYEQI